MARRRRQEEPENHERWLVSYADFMTLLFAFFVVMYAISSVNEGKYKTLSHSLMAAFHTPSRTIEPVQVGVLARTREQNPMAFDTVPRNMPLPEQLISKNDLEALDLEPSESDSPLERISKRIVEEMRPLIEADLITIRKTSLWLEVELSTTILFDSGSVSLVVQAKEVLEQLADILGPFPNPIRVEGFTDTVPINTPQFASNWELSAARAARVVRLFEQEGVEPVRMAAVGFGEHRSTGDNDTPEGRSRNRRVSLVILAGQDSRHMMDENRDRDQMSLPFDPRAQGDAP